MKMKVGILSACFVMMSYLCLSPVLADIHNEFAGDVSAVQMLITLPSLVALVFSLLAGRMAGKIHKKTLILLSIGAYMVGGFLPLVFNSQLWILLLCSGIMGVGTGGMITMTSAIICDYYDGRERSRMMGLQAALISGGGMVFTMLGGYLAAFGWRRAYLAFILLIPCFILAVKYLPTGMLEKAQEKKSGGRIPAYVWFMSVVGFVFYVFQNSYNTNISLYMQETGLGGVQAASIATSVNTFAGILAGVLLSQVMSVFKSHSVTLSVLTAGIGLILTYVGGSFVLIMLGGFLIGFAFSTFTPAGTCLVSEHVGLAQRSMSIAIVSASNNVGAALSPVLVNGITSALITGADVRVKFLIGALVLGFVTVITGIKICMEKETSVHSNVQNL